MPEHDLLVTSHRHAHQMKLTLFSGTMAFLTLLVTAGSAQNPAPESEQRLMALIQQVQAQQAQIVANQDKIDSKLAEVTDAIRVARIFAGRGGK